MTIRSMPSKLPATDRRRSGRQLELGARVRFTRSAVGSFLLDQDGHLLPRSATASNRLTADLVRNGRITGSGLGISRAGHHPAGLGRRNPSPNPIEHRRRCHLRRWILGPRAVSSSLAQAGGVRPPTDLVSPRNPDEILPPAV